MFLRCIGGAVAPAPVLLSPLDDLARSTTRWVQNSYINGVASDGAFNPDYGGVTSVASNVASITQTSGYAAGFVTRCESGKSYDFKAAVTGTAAGTRVRVMYFNGTTKVDHVDVNSNELSTFAVPANVTDVVLVPIMSNDGTMAFSIDTLAEHV